MPTSFEAYFLFSNFGIWLAVGSHWHLFRPLIIVCVRTDMFASSAFVLLGNATNAGHQFSLVKGSADLQRRCCQALDARPAIAFG